MSGCILLLSNSHSPVFLVNSCLDRFSAPPQKREDPLSRSYRVSLPSSLTVIHSSALVYSTRPRVSVYGTGAAWLELSGFSREYDYARYCRPPKGLAYSQGRLKPRICLGLSTPTPFNGLFRQPAALPLFRLHVAPCASTGILTGSAIGLATRLSLRARLTLIRLALIRKPWSYGGQVSRLPYRYLYLHLLFQKLQKGSRPTFNAVGMLPYR